MKYLLDTNVLSDFVRGESAVMARLKRELPRNLALGVISELEVEYGLMRAPHLAPQVATAMRALLGTIAVLPFEREDAHAGARLRANLAARGTPIGAYDLLLAACALRRGLILVTHNVREFARVDALTVEDWRS
ncbi:MAG: PIN domain-containing protein [Proteobacteria bacterium]|nr:PIN domain-containing protein [Pseudomonadota bacterium]